MDLAKNVTPGCFDSPQHGLSDRRGYVMFTKRFVNIHDHPIKVVVAKSQAQ